jgi:hypothetical protein
MVLKTTSKTKQDKLPTICLMFYQFSIDYYHKPPVSLIVFEMIYLSMWMRKDKIEKNWESWI